MNTSSSASETTHNNSSTERKRAVQPRTVYECYATCIPGAEEFLAAELKELGVRKVRPLGGGVSFFCPQEYVLKVCMWSRVSGRVSVLIGRADATNANTLYASAKALPWHEVIAPRASFAVKAYGTNNALRNTQFNALKVKDALCDALVEAHGARPNVNTQNPDALIELRIRNTKATLWLDLAAGSLSKRAYLGEAANEEAPLLVSWAAVLMRALCAEAQLKEGVALVDPACDQGILVCEAAALLADCAPGLGRVRWGFAGWKPFEPALWEEVQREAQNRFEHGLVQVLGEEGAALEKKADLAARARIVGISASSPAVYKARQLLERAGLLGVASIEAASTTTPDAAVARFLHTLVASCASPSRSADDARFMAEQAACVTAARAAGVCEAAVVANQVSASCEGAEEAGVAARAAFQDATGHSECGEGVDASLPLSAFVGLPALDARLRIKPCEHVTLGKGDYAADLLVFNEAPQNPATIQVPNPTGGADLTLEVNEEASAQFAARLRKVWRERRKWAAREHIHAYRLYDADLPEYACAIDIYEGTGDSRGKTFAHVAEYRAPKNIDEARARARFEDVLTLVPAVLGLRPDQVFSKARQRAKGGSQYSQAGGRHYITHTLESNLIFELDLGGYLDTGLFLDHRITRELVGEKARGKRFLNLFAYTGAATVHAIAGGAKSSVTVDLSQTYLEWAQRNLENNGIRASFAEGTRGGAKPASPHLLVRSDVMAYITEARRKHLTFDFIFVDPPTFSNSKAMGKRTWDVQRDHVELLVGVSRLLSAGGEGVFSCNLRTFTPDIEKLKALGVELIDITDQTIPHDFERNKRIHKCYVFRRF
jgi:23S rRNA (guanine2445-N2)-methyltransferase / 23S rRNA (guanine2069-N7)-methyltransferase